MSMQHQTVILQNNVSKLLDKCDVPIKVMEKTGEAICNLLVKSYPCKRKNSNDPKCAICHSGSKINCRTRDVVYVNYCEHHAICKGTYVGETADPIKERFREHLDDYRLRPQKSAMHAHSIEKHCGEEVGFKVKLQGVCQGDPLLKQCMEAVLIRNVKPCMNCREEWGEKRNTSTTIHTNTTTSKEHTTRR